MLSKRRLLTDFKIDFPEDNFSKEDFDIPPNIGGVTADFEVIPEHLWFVVENGIPLEENSFYKCEFAQNKLNCH